MNVQEMISVGIGLLLILIALGIYYVGMPWALEAGPIRVNTIQAFSALFGIGGACLIIFRSKIRW